MSILFCICVLDCCELWVKVWGTRGMDEQKYFVLKKSESTSQASITITIATDHNVILKMGEHVINWE
jgi:hypothetical protein